MGELFDSSKVPQPIRAGLITDSTKIVFRSRSASV
eukprot:SAG25_NODE_340_length_9458_cov_4.740571_8_plen_35_part_00